MALLGSCFVRVQTTSSIARMTSFSAVFLHHQGVPGHWRRLFLYVLSRVCQLPQINYKACHPASCSRVNWVGLCVARSLPSIGKVSSAVGHVAAVDHDVCRNQAPEPIPDWAFEPFHSGCLPRPHIHAWPYQCHADPKTILPPCPP